jgi:hypothetical protein
MSRPDSHTELPDDREGPSPDHGGETRTPPVSPPGDPVRRTRHQAEPTPSAATGNLFPSRADRAGPAPGGRAGGQVVVDLIASLAESEGQSLIRLIAEPPPSMVKCSDHVRDVLLSLERERFRRERDLLGVLARWGVPKPPARGPEPDPFLSLLSMRFLLTKLAEAQQLLRSRYFNARPIVATSLEAEAIVLAHLRNVEEGFIRLDRELRAMGLEAPPEV